MYRGSRLAASFLLVLTGSAATAIGFGVVPGLVGPNAWPLAFLAIAFGILAFLWVLVLYGSTFFGPKTE